MKYWVLTTEYPPFFGGGISTYSYHTSRMLTTYGHEVTIFVPSQDIDREIVVEENGKVRVIRFRPGNKPYYHFLGWIAALSFQFSEIVEHFISKDGPPDIIEAQDYLGVAYFLLQKKYTMCSLIADIPIIITIHTPKFICDLYDRKNIYKLPDFWTGEMERFCIKAADALISPSRYLLQELEKHVDLRDVITQIIPNPFEYDVQFGSMFYSDMRGGTKDRIIFFGRLQYIKGIIQLIENMREIWDDGIPIRIELIGGDWFSPTDGQMMSEILKKKYRKYFDKGLISWLGLVSPDALPEIFSQTRLAIIPSLFENFPYAVLELLASGVLVLASDSGGHVQIIKDGHTGFLFSHTKKNSFKQKFWEALNISDQRRDVMIQNARLLVREMCSYRVVYERKIEFIERIREKKCPRRLFPFIRNNNIAESSARISIVEDIQEKSDLLSVVIPYYNMGETIGETIKSVIESHYQEKEIIIVNDGSDDPYSIAVLYRIAKEYSVKIIHKKNEGLAKARNEGARHARGEFLTFLDADDMVHPDYYELAIRILKKYDNVSFVGCWTEYFGASQGIWPTWNPEPPFLLVHNTINSSGLVFKRKEFISFGLNDPDMIYGMEDYESVVRMVAQGCNGVIIPRPLFKYRVRPASMFRQLNKERMIYLYRLITEKNREIFQRYATDIINLLNSNGPGYLYDNPTRELPPVGFIAEIPAISQMESWTQSSIPLQELKQVLLTLWNNRLFRKMIQIFLFLKIHNIFLRSTKSSNVR